VHCWRFGAAARREEEEYPFWIFDRRATPLQWQRSATLRARLRRAVGGVAPQLQSAIGYPSWSRLATARGAYEMGSIKSEKIFYFAGPHMAKPGVSEPGFVESFACGKNWRIKQCQKKP